MNESKLRNLHIQKKKNEDRFLCAQKTYKKANEDYAVVQKSLSIGVQGLSDVMDGWQSDEAISFISVKELDIRDLWQKNQINIQENDDWFAQERRAFSKRKEQIEEDLFVVGKER